MAMFKRPRDLGFSPYVPKELKGERSLMGFPYRNMKLNISVSGYGDEVKEFVLDGKRQKNAFVPADLEGEHSVEIKMGGRTDKSYTILHDNVPVVQTADTSYVLPQAAEGKWQVLAVDAAGSEDFTSAPVRIYSEENVVPVNVKMNLAAGSHTVQLMYLDTNVNMNKDTDFAIVRDFRITRCL
jgi:hypothetical protein